MPGWLRRVSLDWHRFDEASRISGQILSELAANRSLLRAMVLEAAEDERLRAFAEKHRELHYIVLWDALDRGLRIRLHRFSQGLEDIPHNHRFSFSSIILSGSYVHTLYALTRVEEGSAEGEWRLEQPEGTCIDGRVEQVCVGGLTTVLSTIQAAGSAYTMHHQAIHKTAMPMSDAFSLFIRGPAQKPCSLQLQPDARTYRWKFGREREAAGVINDRVMSPLEYHQFVEFLEAAGII